MNKRLIGIFGLATLGLALVAPVQAAPNFMDGAFMMAKREQADEIRQDQRDSRKDKRRATQSEAAPEEPQNYGYGYERRQQERIEEDSRRRGRR